MYRFSQRAVCRFSHFVLLAFPHAQQTETCFEMFLDSESKRVPSDFEVSLRVHIEKLQDKMHSYGTW